MINLISFIKKQKLFVFLFLVILLLLVIKFFLSKPTPLEKQAESPAPSGNKIVSPPKKTEKEKYSEEAKEPLPSTKIPYDPVNEALKEVLEEKPWLLMLPIVEKNYIIDYLGEEKGFRILMTIDITSSLTRDEQIAAIKKEAPEKLKQIGVDLSKEEIYYTFIP
ncbi:MAG TPA: hypothetical protein VMW29_02285 [Candidatus Bathyarchaeia archaeon]|nr:hypothetical protein [Candidatus Bathyarchaeia archaeon]